MFGLPAFDVKHTINWLFCKRKFKPDLKMQKVNTRTDSESALSHVVWERRRFHEKRVAKYTGSREELKIMTGTL